MKPLLIPPPQAEKDLDKYYFLIYNSLPIGIGIPTHNFILFSSFHTDVLTLKGQDCKLRSGLNLLTLFVKILQDWQRQLLLIYSPPLSMQ